MAGFAIALFLAIAVASALSAAATQRETRAFAAQVDASRTERAERLVENAYAASDSWQDVQMTVSQVGGLYGWHVMVTDADGNLVADSHELVLTSFRRPERNSYRRTSYKSIPIVVNDRVVGEMLIAESSRNDPPALAVSEYGDTLFDSFGIEREGGPDHIYGPDDDDALRSSRDGVIPAELLSGSDQSAQQTAELVLSELDQLLIEPPLTDLEKSFQRSLILAGLAAMAGGLVFVTVFTRQALSPVRGLTSAARKLGSGDLSYRVPETRDDEIGELARTFNEMATDLESAELQRRRMTADIAHELRTPLTNIQGYLEAIKDGVVQPDTETIGSLHSQTVHLSHLVDDLRLLSVAEAGALRLEMNSDSLESVAREAVNAFQPRANERGIDLSLEIGSGVPHVDLDRTRMRQVIANLVENAFHHTSENGSVAIDLSRSEAGEAVMRISDTGRGIPAEELPRIFEQFYRVDPSRARATGGAGLGLTIVRRLVEAHGGQITVESEVGKGTSFLVTLPASTDQS